MKIKVYNLKSPRTGKPVANQFVIESKDGTFFQSYNSIIARKFHCSSFPENGCHEPHVQLDTNYWNYSVTTGKYRNIFLGETKKETEAKIKSGEYKLANLN